YEKGKSSTFFMCLLHIGGQPSYDLRMLGGHILCFRGVVVQIVECHGSHRGFLGVQAHRFPAAHAHGLLPRTTVEFPIQERMLPLLISIAQQRRQQRNAITMPGPCTAGYFHQRGHDVPESTNKITLAAGRYFSRPFYDQGYTYAALVKIPLVSTQPAGAIEKLRVRAALHMRAIVAAE